ncbi:hypothetical protein D3C80_1549450 [compost metagenome]
MAADAIGKTAVATNNGRLYLVAQMLIPGHTGVAVHTAAAIPTNAHHLANLQPFVLRMGAQFGDFAHHLMAGHERVVGHAPFIIEHGEVGVADATVIDSNFNLIVA